MAMKKVAILVVLLMFCFYSGAGSSKAKGGEEDFNFIVFGDSRFATPGEPLPEAFKRIMEESRLILPDFMVHTGDIVMIYGDDEKGVQEEYARTDDYLSKVTRDIYFVPGNHDYSTAANADHFKKFSGQTRDYYSFDFKGAAFIILNTEMPGQVGRIDGEQQAWLERELESKKDSRAVFVFMHRPLFTPPVTYRDKNGKPKPPAKFFVSDQERTELINLFVKYQVTAVFAGHQHLYYRNDYQGVPFITIGGSGASFSAPVDKGGIFHYMIVSVSGGDVYFNLMEPFQFSAQIKTYSKEGRIYGEALINNLHGEMKRGSILMRGIKIKLPKGKYKIKAESVISHTTLMQAGPSVLTIEDYGESVEESEQKLRALIIKVLKPSIYKEEPDPGNPELVDFWVSLEVYGTFPVRLTLSPVTGYGNED